MALEITNLVRVFKVGSLELSDPNPSMSPSEVKDFFAGQYPEITAGEIQGPVIENDKQVFTFAGKVGTKG